MMAGRKVKSSGVPYAMGRCSGMLILSSVLVAIGRLFGNSGGNIR